MIRGFLIRSTVFCLLTAGLVRGMDLQRAVVVTPHGASRPVQKAAQMLREEIEKRTEIRLAEAHQLPGNGQPAIIVGLNRQLEGLAANLLAPLPPAPQGNEGFRVAVTRNVVVVAGNSDRAVVFGAGYLLRHLEMRRGKILRAADDLKVATAPKSPCAAINSDTARKSTPTTHSRSPCSNSTSGTLPCSAPTPSS